MGVVWCAALAWAMAAPGARASEDEASRELDVRVSSRTGATTFVTARDGGAIDVSPHPGRAAAEPLDFLIEYGHLFGVSDPTRQLRRARSQTDGLGCLHTPYEQVHEGVPVFSGMLKVHQDASGRFVGASGRFYLIRDGLSTRPRLRAETATEVARLMLGDASAQAALCELVIVDPGWYGDPPLGARLAYYLVLTNAAAGTSEAFFIDAHRGDVLDRWSTVYHVLNRSIHDAAGGASVPGPLARAEGDGPVADADVNAAYDYIGDTYTYFFNAFGRDSYDDLGSKIIATMNSGAIACPNASWSFSLWQMVFCTGTASDDIVAHELTHGLTQATANLIYQNQSGQLNESFSDVFGELVDLFNGDAAFAGPPTGPPFWPVPPDYVGPGTDTPNNLRGTGCTRQAQGYPDGVRWLIAEDASAFGGELRDMWNPALCFGDPDFANSPLQTCSITDNGGVHSGSAVPNHAFAMLCDGKTFNGFAVNGIGPIKAGAVWYRALVVYLTVASDFEDAYVALNLAAADLVGTFPNDPRTGLPSADMFTASDAVEVDKALLAVEMNTPGACGKTIDVLDAAPAAECSAQTVLFSDDFEGGIGGWTVFNSGPPTAYDWQQVSALPWGRAGTAWFCSDPNIGSCGGTGSDEASTHTLLSPVIALPPVLNLPALAFTHYVETEPRYDGGNLSLSVDGGPWEIVPVSAFRHNAYNTFHWSTQLGNTNPLAGQLAFSGVGGTWGTSLVDLGGFVSGGETIQLRFDFGKDSCFGFTGWYLDDFRIYTCDTSTDCNANGVPDEIDIAGGPQAELLLRQVPNNSSGSLSDEDPHPSLGVNKLADNLVLARPRRIDVIKLWGAYTGDTPVPDIFTVKFHTEAGGLPGMEISAETNVPSSRVATGNVFLNVGEWEYTLTLTQPVSLAAGSYFVEIYNNTAGSSTTFIWERSSGFGQVPGMANFGQGCDPWCLNPDMNLSMELYGGVVGADCNGNGTPDACEIDAGSPAAGGPFYCTANCDPDCNVNGVPDACDPDGDGDGIPDACDACPNRKTGDVNGDGLVDVGDVAGLVSVLLVGTPDPEVFCAADVNADAFVNGEDIGGFVGLVLSAP